MKSYLQELENSKRSADGHLMKEYLCICGNKKFIQKRLVDDGTSKSCGCFKKKFISDKNTKHGMRSHPLYSIHNAMLQRCNNTKCKDYSLYGERGISVCARWNDLSLFIEDMYPSYKKGLSIDRINNNGNYELTNCRWATAIQQANNKRKIYEKV